MLHLQGLHDPRVGRRQGLGKPGREAMEQAAWLP